MDLFFAVLRFFVILPNSVNSFIFRKMFGTYARIILAVVVVFFLSIIKTAQGEQRQKKEYRRLEPPFSTFLSILALFCIHFRFFFS